MRSEPTEPSRIVEIPRLPTPAESQRPPAEHLQRLAARYAAVAREARRRLRTGAVHRVQGDNRSRRDRVTWEAGFVSARDGDEIALDVLGETVLPGEPEGGG